MRRSGRLHPTPPPWASRGAAPKQYHLRGERFCGGACLPRPTVGVSGRCPELVPPARWADVRVGSAPRAPRQRGPRPLWKPPNPTPASVRTPSLHAPRRRERELQYQPRGSTGQLRCWSGFYLWLLPFVLYGSCRIVGTATPWPRRPAAATLFSALAVAS